MIGWNCEDMAFTTNILIIAQTLKYHSYVREVVQNVKNRLDCREFHVNNPVTSNAIGHIWVNGY